MERHISLRVSWYVHSSSAHLAYIKYLVRLKQMVEIKVWIKLGSTNVEYPVKLFSDVFHCRRGCYLSA